MCLFEMKNELTKILLKNSQICSLVYCNQRIVKSINGRGISHERPLISLIQIAKFLVFYNLIGGNQQPLNL